MSKALIINRLYWALYAVQCKAENYIIACQSKRRFRLANALHRFSIFVMLQRHKLPEPK